jgi:hypothetical protein
MKSPYPWYKHWFNEDEIRIIATLLCIFLLGAVVKACRHAPEVRALPARNAVQDLHQVSEPRRAPDEE